MLSFARQALRTLRFVAEHPATRGARVGAIGRAAVWQAYKRVTRRPVVATVAHRARILVTPWSTSGSAALYAGLYEYEEMQFVLAYLRPGDLFVDVGANVGVYSVFVSTLLDGIDVIAAEPFAQAREVLERNRALNHLRFRVEPCAVGASSGSIRFTVGRGDTVNRIAVEGDASESLEVPMRTLDELVGPRVPALVKIDVEGAELSVFEGASKCLSSDRAPVLLFELNEGAREFGTTPTAIRALLGKYGYTLRLCEPGLPEYVSEDIPRTTGNVLAIPPHEEARRRLSELDARRMSGPVPVQLDFFGAGR